MHSTASRQEMEAVVALADIGFAESTSEEPVDHTEMSEAVANKQPTQPQQLQQEQQHQQQSERI